MRSHPWCNGLWMAAVVVLMGGLWVSFAPERAGGQAAYVIVAGASMEPALHRGDLVIARQTGDYQVGEIVAYRHPMVGPVIHRILASGRGHFTLKGDANEWTDSYEPTEADILGEAWIRVPGAGNLLLQLRRPSVLSLLALGISALLVTTVVPMKRTTTSHAGPGPSHRAFAALPLEPGTLQTAIFLLGLISLLALLLAIPAWTHPLDRLAPRMQEYTQRGAFGYAARVPAGVYDRGTLQAGDPVYLRLNQALNIQFDYEFASDAPTSLHGTTALQAEIRDVNGWHRVLELQPAQPFQGTAASALGVLDLDTARKYIADLERLTGVVRPFYTLVVTPAVSVTGQIGGQPVHAAFAPPLIFQLDSLELQLVSDGAAEPGEDPLLPSEPGAVEYQVSEPNRIGLLGASIGVRAARWISGIGLLLGLGGLAALAWLMSRAQRLDPEACAAMRFDAQIVDVEGGTFAAEGPTLEVSGLDDLARVAARSNSVVHRVRSAAGNEYFVQEYGRLYRLAPRPDERSAAGEEG